MIFENSFLADCIIPAAGLSRRMGEHKLSLLIQGKTLLELSASNASAAGLRLILVTAPGRGIPLSILEIPGLLRAENPRPEEGMLSSIKSGLPLVGSESFFVAPADMPFIKSSLFRTILKAWGGRPVFPRFRGELGHPVLIPSRLIGEILALPTGSKLRGLLLERDPDFVDLDEEAVLFDIDTPEDYERALREYSIPGSVFQK